MWQTRRMSIIMFKYLLNNSNNNNNSNNAYWCLWCCHHGTAIARVHPVHFMNVERRQAAADPQTKPNDLGCESACRLPESTPTIAIYYYYSIYRPTEGRRLSRSGWLVTHRDDSPARRRSHIMVLTGSDVAQLYLDQGQRVTTKPNRQPIYSLKTPQPEP